MKKTMTGVLGGVVLGGLLLFIGVTLQGTKSPLYGRWIRANQTQTESVLEFYPNGRYLSESTDGTKSISTYRIVNDYQIAYPGLMGSETICEYTLKTNNLEIRCSEYNVGTFQRDQ